MPAYPASRSRACARQCISFALQAQMDSSVRIVYPKISSFIQTQAEQSPFRAESRRVVRAGASRGRLRRDLRRLVAATFELATALSRLAGAAKTRIRR